MSSLGIVNTAAPPDRRGAVVSSIYVVFYLGVAVPVVAMGAAADRFGLQRATTGFAIVLAVISGLVGLLCSLRAKRAPG